MNAARIAVALLLAAAIVSAPGWSSVPAGWIALFLTLSALDDHVITRDAKTGGLIHRAAGARIGMFGAWASSIALIAAIFVSVLPGWVVAVYGFAAAWTLVPPISVGVLFLLGTTPRQRSATRPRRRQDPPDPRANAMPAIGHDASPHNGRD